MAGSSRRPRRSASPARSTTLRSRPTRSSYCLTEAGVTAERLDYVGFYDKPLLKFERLLETYLAYAPSGFRSFRKAMPLWAEQEAATSRGRCDRALGSKRTALRLHRAPRVPRRQRLLPVAVRGGGDPDAGRRRRVGHRDLGPRPRATRSPSTARCGSRTRSGCSTRPSPITPASRSMSGEYKLMGLAPYGETHAIVDLILEAS